MLTFSAFKYIIASFCGFYLRELKSFVNEYTSISCVSLLIRRYIFAEAKTQKTDKNFHLIPEHIYP